MFVRIMLTLFARKSTADDWKEKEKHQTATSKNMTDYA